MITTAWVFAVKMNNSREFFSCFFDHQCFYHRQEKKQSLVHLQEWTPFSFCLFVWGFCFLRHSVTMSPRLASHLLCSRGWPHALPASDSSVLRLQTCTTTHAPYSFSLETFQTSPRTEGQHSEHMCPPQLQQLAAHSQQCPTYSPHSFSLPGMS
jgi:hypothetical protein